MLASHLRSLLSSVLLMLLRDHWLVQKFIIKRIASVSPSVVVELGVVDVAERSLVRSEVYN